MNVRLSTFTVGAWAFASLAGSLCAADFSIADFGACTGASCSQAFSRAIDACSRSGGGRVLVPAGRWVTGAIRLKSHVELHLDARAEILFSQNPADYLPAVFTSWEGMECWNYCPLIYAYGCTNVAITGKGTLRAYEGEWKKTVWSSWASGGASSARRQLYDWGATDYPLEKREIYKMKNSHTRPQFVQFNRCTGIRWEDFKVRNSPFWTLHLYLCTNAVVRGLDVVARASNNDGIDIEMSRDVLVEQCTFDQGDDTFVLKSGRNRDAWRIGVPTENVEIRNCHMKRARSFFCCGSEISGGIRHVRFHDCSVEKASQVCYVKTNRRRGAFVEDVCCENIRAKTCTSLVNLSTDVLYEWANFPDYELRTTRIGNLTFRNVGCESANCRVDIQGDASLPIDGVRLENVLAHQVCVDDRFVNVRHVTDDGRAVRCDGQVSVADFDGNIQDAINHMAKAGGGRVFVPGGDWPSGPLDLANGVELHLASNARILFSDDPARYRLKSGAYRSLLRAEDVARIRISGYGRIEAKTKGWQAVPLSERPPLMSFKNCRRVHVESASIRNTPSRVLVAEGCRGFFVSSVEFIADIGERDFCTFTDCSDYMVRGCSFWIGDGSVTPDYGKLRQVNQK